MIFPFSPIFFHMAKKKTIPQGGIPLSEEEAINCEEALRKSRNWAIALSAIALLIAAIPAGVALIYAPNATLTVDASDFTSASLLSSSEANAIFAEDDQYEVTGLQVDQDGEQPIYVNSTNASLVFLTLDLVFLNLEKVTVVDMMSLAYTWHGIPESINGITTYDAYTEIQKNARHYPLNLSESNQVVVPRGYDKAILMARFVVDVNNTEARMRDKLILALYAPWLTDERIQGDPYSFEAELEVDRSSTDYSFQVTESTHIKLNHTYLSYALNQYSLWDTLRWTPEDPEDRFQSNTLVWPYLVTGVKTNE